MQRGARGFSMIELLVAMGVFLVISSAAISLFRAHAPVYSKQLNQAALNTTLRNALAQLQIDAVNAGSNNFPVVAPNSAIHLPIGITFTNAQGGAGCYNAATRTYGPGCFDSLTIVAANSNTPPVHPSDIGANCVSTTASSLFVTPPAGTTTSTLAGDFHAGDQLLLMKQDGSQMNTIILSKDGQPSGGKVNLQHNPQATCTASSGGCDPLGIEMLPQNKLGTTFCTSDWVLNLNASSTTYSVDTTIPSNPRLMRTQAGGAPSIVAEQVIGFKVGAATWNNAAATSSDFYDFNPNSPAFVAAGGAFDFTTIQSVRVSLIVRSSPAATDATDTYRNAFDGGAYRIQAMSVVVNPRNMSMQDNPN